MTEKIMANKKIILALGICSYVNGDNSKPAMEIILPGVQKRDIKLKMNQHDLSFGAQCDTIEDASSPAFCCQKNFKDAKATYENGLVRINVLFGDAMAGAFNVSRG